MRSKQNQFLKALICIFKEFIHYLEGKVEQLKRFLYYRIETTRLVY